MRKIIIVLWIFLLFPSITWAQQKVEAPVWNVGDKWVFTEGNIEVVGSDQNTYTLNFSKELLEISPRVENKGLIVFDKSTLNRIYVIVEDKREKYTTLLRRRILNFPFNLGKEWEDAGSLKPSSGPMKGTVIDYSETFRVLEWENLKVQAGNFKTIKLEYTLQLRGNSGKSTYWYAPEAKYFVKCQYDKLLFFGVKDWELASFKLNK